MAAPSLARRDTEEAFLDAAERLLVAVGHGGITTRRVAQEAGANHGLVHYYFGSMENLLARVLERFTDRLIARQREMYAAPGVPFEEKWRTAMRFLDADREYQKVWFELQALAWTRPELRERVAGVNAEWRGVLTEALAEPRERRGIEHAARRARVTGHDLQRGDHPRAAVGDPDRSGRAARVDRRLARTRRLER